MRTRTLVQSFGGVSIAYSEQSLNLGVCIEKCYHPVGGSYTCVFLYAYTFVFCMRTLEKSLDHDGELELALCPAYGISARARYPLKELGGLL
jgi:hypothetical protein